MSIGDKPRNRKRKRSRVTKKKRYTSDLTTAQWLVIKPLIPEAKPGGRPRSTNIREMLNGIFYRLKNACSWGNLPKDFPPNKTVSRYHREWTLDGTFEKIHAALRTMVRQKAGKADTPTAGVIDSQSAETTEQGGARGYDAGKKINGRKRHILVDTLGMMWGGSLGQYPRPGWSQTSVLDGDASTRHPVTGLGRWRLCRALVSGMAAKTKLGMEAGNCQKE